MGKMKLAAIVVAVACAAASASAEYKQERSMRLDEVTASFANPPKEFRPAPLWVWNTDVTTDDIDRMLTDLKEQGFGGAFVHPRPGLVTEYLSPEWFRLWKYSIDKGRELGLDISIYDENSYPSGFAGGHVPAAMPESYNQGSALKGTRTTTPPASADECYMCLLRTGDSFTDITEQLADYQGREGDYYVYTKLCHTPAAWTAGFPYTDLLVPGVTEKFIEVTMTNGYEKYMPEEIGTGIRAIFTDEPNIVSPHWQHSKWCPDLFEQFQARWGYDLRPYWPMLGEDVGDYRRVRHNYHSTLQQLFIERWAKPWYEYTQAHNMAFTGHYWEHDWPNLQQAPDPMAMYAWHTIPAIDMLFNQYDDNGKPQAQFGNVRSVKELRSVANQMGYVRTLCETYGGGGWDEGFKDFKRLGDWEYALGVNYMNQHLAHMTITGTRKYDYPPVFTPLSPWYGDYGKLNDYFARLSLMLSQGEQINKWLIIEPTTSLWMYFSNTADGTELWKIANAFQEFISWLEKNQMEYDLGCENIIADRGYVNSDGSFDIGHRTYYTVVLPPEMENLDSTTFEMLRHAAEVGGRIIAFPQLKYVDGSESAELAEFMASGLVTIMHDPQEVLDLYRSEAPVSITQYGDGHVYHQRRRFYDGELLFFVNSSETDNAQVAFTTSGTHMAMADAMTGEIINTTPTFGTNAGKLSHTFTLPPAGSALFIVAQQPMAYAIDKPSRTFGTTPLQAKGDVKISPLRDNALVLDFCDLAVDGSHEEKLFYKEANTRMWKHFRKGDPWETAVQFRDYIVRGDTMTNGNITVDFPLVVDDPTLDLSNIKIIVERPDIWQVLVNGTAVPQYEQDKLIDPRCGVFNVGSLLHNGKNTISIHLDRMRILAEVGPIIVLGNFSLKPMDAGFAIEAPKNALTLGDYAKQGYQMYPWEMCYTKTYNITDTTTPRRIVLDDWKGSLAQVWVNGKKAGIISTEPYELDITDHLRRGDNTVEVRVIGSIVNLYGPHYAEPSGIMGPWMWNGIDTQRPGAEYSLFPFGLNTDFQMQ